MQANSVTLETEQIIPKGLETQPKNSLYYNAEQVFSQLINAEDLDINIQKYAERINKFETTLRFARPARSLRTPARLGRCSYREHPTLAKALTQEELREPLR
ncbi:MAG: hypothetical protein HC851_21030 [Acaryochloris sp. RU_4_1]|nr:hypothetical protein [Acaryochloris sp. RU_4_1]